MSVVVTWMMASVGSVMSGTGRVCTCMSALPCHSHACMVRVGSSLYLAEVDKSDLVGGLNVASMASCSFALSDCDDGWSALAMDMVD